MFHSEGIKGFKKRVLTSDYFSLSIKLHSICLCVEFQELEFLHLYMFCFGGQTVQNSKILNFKRYKTGKKQIYTFEKLELTSLHKGL